MKTIKSVGNAVFGTVVVFGYLAFMAVAVSTIAAREYVGRRRGRSARSSQPKTFYPGVDGVPHLVMDADGFVEPPAQIGHSISSAPTGSAGSKYRGSAGVNMGHMVDTTPQYKSGGQWPKPSVAIGVVGDNGRMEDKVVEFPTTDADKRRLIAGRKRQPSTAPIGGEKVVQLTTFRHGRRK